LVADSPKSATKINISLSEMALLVKKRQNFSRLNDKKQTPIFETEMAVSKKKTLTGIPSKNHFDIVVTLTEYRRTTHQ